MLAVSSPRESASPLRILLVDDDRDAVFAVSQCLELSEGVTVLTAYDGQEGVRVAEAERPDVILLDVMMPVMDGLTACSMLAGNSATHDIPIIMLTARSDVSTAVDCFRLGAVNYIIKPIDPGRLLSKILETLDRMAAQREASSKP